MSDAQSVPSSDRRSLATVARRLAAALSGALIGAAVLGASLVVAPAPPARAADLGPAYTEYDNGGLGYLGAYRIGDRNYYCLEPRLDWPVGVASQAIGYGGWGGASPEDIARANRAISTIGQSTDRRITAAVQMYVWWLLARDDYDRGGVSGDERYGAFVPDPAERNHVLSWLAGLRADGASIRVRPAGGTGTLAITGDAVDPYMGTVRVQGLSPADATGTLVLQNARFDATGSPSIAGVRDGEEFAFTTLPPDGATPYKVGVSGTFSLDGWPAELELWSTAAAQTLAGGGRTLDGAFSLWAADGRPRTAEFRPVVTTQAQPRVEPGEHYRDVLRFALAADEAGRIGRWYRLGPDLFLPITASCRVYGPFEAPPAPAAAVPPGAPLASTFAVTTGPDGPLVDYPAES
ncbi:MAG: hypothetical protein J7480_04930, partial [Microbacteriaceae bacterium]|nr:hypothetical protein [Microbacteriaceae bacterium]